MGKANITGHVKDLPSQNPETYYLLDSIGEWYDWDVDMVDRIGQIAEQIVEAKDPEDWSFILKEHFSEGNAKIANNTLIWNICSATECPHLETERCQVTVDGSTKCYAYANEHNPYFQSGGYGSLDSRRRQQVIWDLLDAETFAKAVECMISRKRNVGQIEYFRLNESGDIRDRHDLLKVNELARRLKQLDISLYCYTASSHVEWEILEERHFTVNGSNPWMEGHADRMFTAKPKEDITDDDFVCPAESLGRDTVKCGECTACIHDRVGDIVVPLH